eukprot:4112353-Prymnesium_polylepis.2
MRARARLTIVAGLVIVLEESAAARRRLGAHLRLPRLAHRVRALQPAARARRLRRRLCRARGALPLADAVL